MEKNESNASVRKNPRKTVPSGQSKSGHLSTYMWLSRFFNVICFVFVGTSSVLALSLLHLTKEAEVDSVLVTAPTYSDNLSYFEPLHPDMPSMDVLAEMFVRQYITTRNNVYPDLKEMRLTWGWKGIVHRMSTQSVYDTFFQTELQEIFSKGDMSQPPETMIDTDIKKIIKEGWNSWQVFFDTHRMNTTIDPPVIEHWIATIQFKYYASNAFMHRRFRNPLGFTVTQYHLAKKKQ